MPRRTAPAPAPTLTISETLSLPLEAATETFAILAKRGKGKTHTASVLAEELIGHGIPVLIVDPMGVWWGLRSSADGASDGLPVVIFGGDHADVSLTEGSGELIADAVVSERFSAILDLSHFSKAARRRFMTPFLERLYHRNRTALHVIIDEADLFAPQRAAAEGAPLLGAMEDLQRRGRSRGIGTTMITQRPAVLHKDILSQAEVLIALGMTGPRDVAAIDEWVRLNADDTDAREVKASLPSLPVGTAWVWSPGFLDILEKVQIRRRWTYDSSATPKVGAVIEPVKKMAAIDLDRLGEQISQAAKQAEETDPKALRRRVRELEAQLAARAVGTKETNRVEVPVEVPVEVRIEVPVVSAEDRELVQSLLDETALHRQSLVQALDLVQAAAESSQTVSQSVLALQTRIVQATADSSGGSVTSTSRTSRVRQAQAPSVPAATPQQAPSPSAPASRPPTKTGSGDGETLPRAARKVLTVLAQHGTRNTTQTAIMAGYSHKSGGYRNTLSSLRTSGFIDGRGEITITDAGLEALGGYEPLPTGSALLEWWKTNQLGKCERAIVDVLAAAYPAAVKVDVLAEDTGYSATSGGFRNALSHLRTLELASGRGELVLSGAFV